MFNNVYKGKKILITGHTGFKGTWLTTWLLKLGANICGVSNAIPSNPSMFEELNLESKIDHKICDIRNLEDIKLIVQDFKPDFVFHLAAQAIVSDSYEDPTGTISTNVLGTANMLESLRVLKNDCAAIFITSDKCYENVEWEWGYKETNALGGRDIYSGSKGAAEIIFHSYYWSFFKDAKENIRLATGRAGNVIGGGDWAKDRIVVDCMVNWSQGKAVKIRCPEATRPWQHVLEPLSGYLSLGAELFARKNLDGESFNFGPKAEKNKTVRDLLIDLSDFWDFAYESDAYQVIENIPFHEAGLLKLNCDKALFHLRWEGNLSYKECVKYVSEWYFSFYNKNEDMLNFTLHQISEYEKTALERGQIWTQS
ncbi:CDP-glucose 4,6-dehydratase [Gammaproteobacteria bacterium]|nr:CDP-glucose 4,6-dehydratase [Gammaproteobacteria bacterium]